MIPEELIRILSEARHVAVLTGAGVSAESGIKTFRDKDGLWSKLNPQELASADGFLSNPELVWEWYSQRRDIVTNTRPNPGHFALAEMENMFPEFSLITQNIDRHHQAAGSTNVIELHGNIVDNHCHKCKRPFEGETALPDKQVPRCPDCGGLIRPSVVWFGEQLPERALLESERIAYDCDVFFSIGTSAEVYPAANIPIIAKRNGCTLVEVNPNSTVLSSFADFVLRKASGEIMPVLLEELKEYKGKAE